MTDQNPHAAAPADAAAAGDGTANAGTPPAAAATTTPEAKPADAAPAAATPAAEGKDAKPAEGTPANKDTKPAEGDKANDKGTDGKDGKADKAEGAPEKYEFTAPEGMEGVEFNQEAADAVTPLFQKYGVTQEDANAIAAIQAKVVSELQTNIIAQQAQVWENRLKGWDAEAAKDPNIGPELEKVQKDVANVIAHYGGANDEERAALSQFFTETGLHRHPAILRFGQHVLKNVLDASDTGPTTGARGGETKNWFPNSGHEAG